MYVSSVTAIMRHCHVLVLAQSRSSTECLCYSPTRTMAPSPPCKNFLSLLVLCTLPDMPAFSSTSSWAFLIFPNPHWLTVCFYLLFVIYSFILLTIIPSFTTLSLVAAYFSVLMFLAPSFYSLISTLLPPLFHPLYSSVVLSSPDWWWYNKVVKIRDARARGSGVEPNCIMY